MPTLTLSITALRAANACGLEDRIADLRTVRPDVVEDEAVPLAVWWALPTTSIPDRWWSLRAAQPSLIARQVAVRGAALAARRVLHLTRDSDRAACEAAIVAAEAWADQPIAASAANAATYTTTAANAAANAANAAIAAAAAAVATTAANAAVDAANAAATAAAAAAAAAYAVDAADAERSAQSSDLDRLLMETSR